MTALKIPPLPNPPDWVRHAVQTGLRRSGFSFPTVSDHEKVAEHVSRVVASEVYPRLTWTAQPPQSEGYYWIRCERLGSRVTQFYVSAGRVLSNYGDLNKQYGHTEYSGPIPLPL